MKKLLIAAVIIGAASLAGVALIGTSSASDVATAEAVTKVFDVEGMTCGGCEVGVRRAVGKIEGVNSVKASHEDGRAEVTFDPGKVTVKQIVEAIEKLGYQAELQRQT